MMRTHPSLTGMFFVLSVATSNAQTPTPAVTGKVVGPSGQPAGGVPLQVQGPAGKTVVFTDTQGEWSLYNLPAGDYKVAPLTKPTVIDQPVKFSVKDKGLVDKLFGAEPATHAASEIKLK
jgi:hypothetical protein